MAGVVRRTLHAEGVGMLDREMTEFREEILERWIEGIIGGYPEETAKFLRSKKDRFANPVGVGLHEGLAELLDGVFQGIEPTELTSALDRVIRVRAVQDFEPSAAVAFVFDLKDILREFVEEGSDGSLDVLDHRIEHLGLSAFDVYMRCREDMWRIRAREIRNQSVGIMERVADWRERREEKSEKVPQS
jgi:hypothetical protein